MIKLESIYKSLNIEEKEIVPVLLLMAQSVFIGIFYGAYDIGAHTLFLKVFPEDMIPKAYIISGLVGIVLTTIFSKIQTRLSFSRLANYSLLFISAIILIMRSMFGFVNEDWVIFIVFIFFGPLNIIAILAFWGTVGRIFNLRQGKRLFGIIDTGQIIGIIISSFSIPLIITFLKGTNNILLISAGSIFLAMFLEMIITKKFNLSEQGDADDTDIVAEDEQVKLKNFVKNPYILYMALFVVFSMFAAFFVQYSFLVVAKEKYPLEEDMATYLGFFTGSMMAFTLLIKTFVYSKLMKTYGLKVSLILSPVLLGLFTLIAIAAGYFGGYTESAPGFIYFFLLISLSKLFNKTLKDALEVPSFKLLYQALAKKIRFDVQAKIDGTINEIAALISGLILYGLGVLVFVKLIHFSVVLFILLGLWTIITIRLYKEYRNNLEKALQQEHEIDESSESQKISKIILNKVSENKALVNYLKLCHDSLTFDYLEIFQSIVKAEGRIFDILSNSKEHFIDLFFLYKANKLEQKQIKEFQKIKIDIGSNRLPPKEIANLLKSNDSIDYFTAISYIFKLNKKERLPILTSLLRTPDVEIQKITVKVCGELNETEVYGTLIEYLGINELFADASIALKQIAKDCYKQLIQIFYKTDITITTQLSIIKLLGYINEEETISFLLDNLSHHRVDIFNQSINSLSNIGYQASETDQPRFFHPITQVIQTLAWDVSALASIQEEKEALLFKSIEFEYHRHQLVLFNLLSLAYDSQSVQHVKEYLDAGTAEGVGYALELFDIFISDEIKPLVLLIFEDVSLVEKTRLLQDHFPIEVMTIEKLIVTIINRDPNLISLSTKQLAIKIYGTYFTDINYDIIAHLFSPVSELKREAARVIKELSPQELPNLLNRVDSKEIADLAEILDDNSKTSEQSSDEKNIDYLIYSEFNQYQINPVEVADYIKVAHFHEHNLLHAKEYINDYFVFLVINRRDFLGIDSKKLKDTAFYFNHFDFDINELKEMNSDQVIVGFEKYKINKLQLTNYDFMHNLITLS